MIPNSESYVLLLSGNKTKQPTALKWVLKPCGFMPWGFFLI